MSGNLITFSGLDGAGKSTQIKSLSGLLSESGRDTSVIWSRGGYTPGFEAIKKISRILTGKKVLPPSGMNTARTQAFQKPTVRKIWLSLAILDLFFLYAFKLRWRRLIGQTVICDRYLWDTLIDFELNFPQESVSTWFLWKLLVRFSPKPGCAFLLVIPVEESLKRSDLKGEPFRDSAEILNRRLQRYLGLIEQGKWIIVNCARPVGEIQTEIAGYCKLSMHRQSVENA